MDPRTMNIESNEVTYRIEECFQRVWVYGPNSIEDFCFFDTLVRNARENWPDGGPACHPLRNEAYKVAYDELLDRGLVKE